MARVTADKVKQVSETCGCGMRLAKELLTLSGGNTELVIEASDVSAGLDQCKTYIINKRFEKLEKGM